MCFAATMNGCTKGTMMNAKAVYQPEKTGPYFNGGNPTMQAWAVLLSEVRVQDVPVRDGGEPREGVAGLERVRSVRSARRTRRNVPRIDRREHPLELNRVRPRV